MLKVGLTGNLYSGYEKASELFSFLGIPVFDADVVLKFILNYRESIIKDIKIQFGETAFEVGLLNPKVFNTTEKFDRLVDIAQLELLRAYESWRLKHKNNIYTIFKSCILFERGLEESMNYTISVFTPKDIRVGIMTRCEIDTSISRVYDIINSEMDELDKNSKASWTIHNYEDAFYSLEHQVRDINSRIEKKSFMNILEESNEKSKKLLIM